MKALELGVRDSTSLRTALVYIRQSRHKDYERTASPEVQRDACLQLPAVQGCDRHEVLEDLDLSGGRTAGRRGYKRLLEKVREGGVAVIAAYDQSRTFRNTADALDFYALMEKHAEIDVVFVHGRFDRSPAGEFTYTTLAAAHAMERRMTAEKMRDAVRHRAAKGELVGMVPAGYRRLQDGTVEIDESLAPLIRHIFERYSSGAISVRALARELNLGGKKLPNAKTAWRGDTIAQLLTNFAYIGMSYTESRRHRRGEPLAGRWPALVDRDLWDQVQQRIATRRRWSGRPVRTQSERYAFRRLLRCTCGLKMRGQAVGDTLYYRCPGTDGAIPCRHLVREDRLLPWGQFVFERLEALRPAGFKRAVVSLRRGSTTSANDAISQLDARLQRLGQRFDWGHVDEAAYRVEWARLNSLKEELLQEQADLVLPFVNPLESWNSGIAENRWQLLSTLFEELDIEGGKVVAVKPNPEHAAQVVELIDQVWPPGRPGLGDGPGGVQEPPQPRSDGDLLMVGRDSQNANPGLQIEAPLIRL